MGFLSRSPGPHGDRRARPAAGRAGQRVAGAKNAEGSRGRGRLRKALQRMAQSLTRNSRSVDGKKLVAVYRHGTCTVNHRSRKVASRCRRVS
jgi:hypothetical protein